MGIISFLIALIAFTILAPLVGGLIAGIDRIISARLQGRVGPPLLQPFYDVRKLLSKDESTSHSYQGFYVVLSMVFTVLAGVFFFAGGNFLLVIFILMLATLFFIVAAYSTRSPFAEIGAEREIVQVMAYEPMVILMAVMFYMGTGTQLDGGSFNIAAVFSLSQPLIVSLPFVFIGLVYILTIKLRKSPFDLSFTHHAHTELVKGISTEMTGRTLAIVEITHWYETVLFLGWVGVFLLWSSWVGILLAIIVVIVIYFLEIFIDNNFARVKWQLMLASSWIVTFVCIALNIILIQVIF